MPILDTVYSILYNGAPAAKAFTALSNHLN